VGWGGDGSWVGGAWKLIVGGEVLILTNFCYTVIALYGPHTPKRSSCTSKSSIFSPLCLFIRSTGCPAVEILSLEKVHIFPLLKNYLFCLTVNSPRLPISPCLHRKCTVESTVQKSTKLPAHRISGFFWSDEHLILSSNMYLKDTTLRYVDGWVLGSWRSVHRYTLWVTTSNSYM
jgi:hypothetical protein